MELERIGFMEKFQLDYRRDNLWNSNFEKLQEYLKPDGFYPPHPRYCESKEEIALSRWIEGHVHGNALLTKERIDKLDSISFPRTQEELKAKRRHGQGYVDWLPYEDARLSAATLGFTDKREYKAWSKNNKDLRKEMRLPSSPRGVYAEWDGWAHYLGYDQGYVDWLPYEEARLCAATLGLTDQREYHAWSKNNKDLRKEMRLPSGPATVYAEWKGWAHYLGLAHSSGR